MFKFQKIVRLLLGLIYFIFGLNGFFLFIPVPPMSEQATSLIIALKNSGLLYFEKSLEVIGGLLLLTNQFPKLATLILAPLTLNILFFHMFLDQGILVLAVLMCFMNAYLGWFYRTAYIPILER